MEFSTAGISTRRRTFNPACHHHVRERQDGGGAAHVLLHQQHAARRLDVEAAGIETDALADQRDFRMCRVAPAHIDQPRRTGGGAADGMNKRKILQQ